MALRKDLGFSSAAVPYLWWFLLSHLPSLSLYENKRPVSFLGFLLVMTEANPTTLVFRNCWSRSTE